MISFTHTADCGETWTNISRITWSALSQRSLNVTSEILTLVSPEEHHWRPSLCCFREHLDMLFDRLPQIMTDFLISWNICVTINHWRSLNFLGIITLPRQTLQICGLIIPAVIPICVYGPCMQKAAVFGTSGGEVNSHPKQNNVFFPLLARTLQPRWYTAELAHSFFQTQICGHISFHFSESLRQRRVVIV